MDKLDTVLASIAQQLADATIKYGPDAAALAGSVLQMVAIKNLLVFLPIVLGLLTGLAVFYYYIKNYNKYVALGDRYQYSTQRDYYGTIAVLSGIFSAFFTVVTLVTAANTVFNPIYWMAAFDWRVAIAAKVLGYL